MRIAIRPLVALLLFSQVACAQNAKRAELSQAEVVSRYSLAELDAAIHGLDAVILGGEWCGQSFESAQHLLLPLRTIYEERQTKQPKMGKKVELLCESQKTKDLISALEQIYTEEYSAPSGY